MNFASCEKSRRTRGESEEEREREREGQVELDESRDGEGRGKRTMISVRKTPQKEGYMISSCSSSSLEKKLTPGREENGERKTRAHLERHLRSFGLPREFVP